MVFFYAHAVNLFHMNWVSEEQCSACFAGSTRPVERSTVKGPFDERVVCLRRVSARAGFQGETYFLPGYWCGASTWALFIIVIIIIRKVRHRFSIENKNKYCSYMRSICRKTGVFSVAAPILSTHKSCTAYTASIAGLLLLKRTVQIRPLLVNIYLEY